MRTVPVSAGVAVALESLEELEHPATANETSAHSARILEVFVMAGTLPKDRKIEGVSLEQRAKDVNPMPTQTNPSPRLP
ncbi:unannotated protein [freshwater metagenome]|uniref:Unannotated protein n=1 Tax=freshwater metagenome TaxID=449393 RepID=A0A6J6Y629_9ZZZZ